MGGTLAVSGGVRPVETSVTGAAGCALRYLSDGGVVRMVAVSDDAFTDSWLWGPKGHFLRAEVVADPSEGAEETRLELSAVGVTLSDTQLVEVLAKPRLRALSNPVYVATPAPSEE